MEIIVIGIVAFLIIKFGGLRTLVSLGKKSEAAAAIQAMLEQQQKVLLFKGDPATAANRYVQEAWDSKPNVFDGKFGVRPHKLSVVAYSLALAAKRLEVQGHDDFGSAMVALGNVISELGANGQYYKLQGVDNSLIEEAMMMVHPIMERENSVINMENWVAS